MLVRVFVASIVIVFFMGFTACKKGANKSKADAAASEANSEAKPAIAEPEAKLEPEFGTPKNCRNFETTVVEMKTAKQVGSNRYSSKKAEEGEIFLIVTVKYKNTDNDASTIGFSGKTGVVAEMESGQTYEFDKEEVALPEYKGSLATMEKVNPLVSKTIKHLYKVSNDIFVGKNKLYFKKGDVKFYLGEAGNTK